MLGFLVALCNATDHDDAEMVSYSFSFLFAGKIFLFFKGLLLRKYINITLGRPEVNTIEKSLLKNNSKWASKWAPKNSF